MPGAAAATDERRRAAAAGGGRCWGALAVLARAAALIRLARGRNGALRAKPLLAASIGSRRPACADRIH